GFARLWQAVDGEGQVRVHAAHHAHPGHEAHSSPEGPTGRLGRYPGSMSLQAPTLPDLRQHVHDAARRARGAARVLATLSTADKDRALRAAADTLLSHMHAILAANAEDLDAARATGTSDALLDRLALNPQRVDGIAAGLRQVAGLPDPIGEVL